ncbi:MAG: hypothetical protein FWG14_11670 [Peptococcaceae bacterium]|nr:hypothetical protein [Peptococcaceae bacterium]
MKKLSSKTMKILKAIHFSGVTVWVSGVMCTLVILLALSQQTSHEGILALLSLIELADYLLIIPGATICYLLGTVYGLFTVWGFIKHKWIILKWILYNIACIPAMIFALPSVEAMRQFVLLNEVAAASVPELRDKLVMHGMLSSYILVIAVVIVFISVYKPFKKRKNTHADRHL